MAIAYLSNIQPGGSQWQSISIVVPDGIAPIYPQLENISTYQVTQWLETHGFHPIGNNGAWIQDHCCNPIELKCSQEYGCDNGKTIIKTIWCDVNGVETCQITDTLGNSVIPSDMVVWGEPCEPTNCEACYPPVVEAGIKGCDCSTEDK